MTNEEDFELFNTINDDLQNVIYKNAFIGEALHEDRLKTTMKALMFFAVKSAHDYGWPLENFEEYVRAVYGDLKNISNNEL